MNLSKKAIIISLIAAGIMVLFAAGTSWQFWGNTNKTRIVPSSEEKIEATIGTLTHAKELEKWLRKSPKKGSSSATRAR